MEIVVRALRDFYLTCVAPYWPHIVATFRADVAERIGVLATGGLAEVLGKVARDPHLAGQLAGTIVAHGRLRA